MSAEQMKERSKLQFMMCRVSTARPSGVSGSPYAGNSRLRSSTERDSLAVDEQTGALRVREAPGPDLERSLHQTTARGTDERVKTAPATRGSDLGLL